MREKLRVRHNSWGQRHLEKMYSFALYALRGIALFEHVSSSFKVDTIVIYHTWLADGFYAHYFIVNSYFIFACADPSTDKMEIVRLGSFTLYWNHVAIDWVLKCVRAGIRHWNGSEMEKRPHPNDDDSCPIRLYLQRATIATCKTGFFEFILATNLIVSSAAAVAAPAAIWKGSPDEKDF